MHGTVPLLAEASGNVMATAVLKTHLTCIKRKLAYAATAQSVRITRTYP